LIGSLAELLLRGRCESLEELSKALGRPREAVASLLRKLGGVEVVEGGRVVVKSRVLLAASAVELGASPHIVSSLLSWKEFEEEVARILEAFGASCTTNFRITLPRRLEADVVAVKGASVLVVDCKHWSSRVSSPSKLEAAASRHAERVELLASSRDFVKLSCREAPPGACVRAYPIVVTLAQKSWGQVAGAVVVPISKLRGFLEEFEGLKYDLPHKVIECPKERSSL